MPELTDNQIADLRVLQHRCAALGAELVIIGAIAYQIHFPAESRHTGGELPANRLLRSQSRQGSITVTATVGSEAKTSVLPPWLAPISHTRVNLHFAKSGTTNLSTKF
jgi:hypothetical protein